MLKSSLIVGNYDVQLLSNYRTTDKKKTNTFDQYSKRQEKREISKKKKKKPRSFKVKIEGGTNEISQNNYKQLFILWR